MPNPGPLPPYLSIPLFLLGTDGAWLRRRWQGVPFSASLGYTQSSSSSIALLSLLQVTSDDDSLPLVPLEPQLLPTFIYYSAHCQGTKASWGHSLSPQLGQRGQGMDPGHALVSHILGWASFPGLAGCLPFHCLTDLVSTKVNAKKTALGGYLKKMLPGPKWSGYSSFLRPVSPSFLVSPLRASVGNAWSQEPASLMGG